MLLLTLIGERRKHGLDKYCVFARQIIKASITRQHRPKEKAALPEKAKPPQSYLRLSYLCHIKNRSIYLVGVNLKLIFQVAVLPVYRPLFSRTFTLKLMVKPFFTSLSVTVYLE